MCDSQTKCGRVPKASCLAAVLWGRDTFFFQAEDGRRCVAVTGVQTCALPISTVLALSMSAQLARADGAAPPAPDAETVSIGERSEERRVGNECCHRWLM